MAYTIFKKSGSPLICNRKEVRIKKFEINGAFLGQTTLTFSLVSPYKIDWNVGEYVIVDGDTYTLNYIPACKKDSRRGYSDSFKYDNVVFNWDGDNLTRVDFLDYVLYDNEIHYSNMPTVYFYGGLRDLASRMKANLDRIYPNEWTVIVDANAPLTEKQITFQNVKVWDALIHVWEDFNTLFYIKGKTIYIGTKENLVSHVFRYGIGRGLKSITSTSSESDAIITRLHVYGSKKNLQYRYYNNMNGVSESMFINSLMLPAIREQEGCWYFSLNDDNDVVKYGNGTLGTRYSLSDTPPSGAQYRMVKKGSGVSLDIYLESLSGIAKYGVFENVETFDNNNNKDFVNFVDDENGIYPHMMSGNTIIGAEQIDDSGIYGEDGSINPATFWVDINPGFDLFDCLIGGQTAQISFKSGALVGRTFEFDAEKIDDNENGGTYHFRLTCNRLPDNSIGLAFPNSDYNAKSGDKYVLLNIAQPEQYVTEAEIRLLKIGLVFLKSYDHTKNVYSPELDDKFLAENAPVAEQLIAGNVFSFADSDINGGTDENPVIISSPITNVKAVYEDGAPTHYEITISETFTTSSLERVQKQIEKISNKVESYTNTNVGNDKVSGDYLSKTHDDTAKGKIKFEKGAEFGEFIKSLQYGKGGGIDGNGNAELESLKVRSSMTVMELIVNRLRAEGSDVVFTDSGTIENVVAENDGSYTLTIRKEYERDFTSFHEHDVLRGKLNNLLHKGEYTTSWLLVRSVNTILNTISVLMYSDDECPGGTNSAPSEGMVLHRWGNAEFPTDGSYNHRQTTWYISATEGRIMYLQGVWKPILEDYNYGAWFGLPVNMSNIAQYEPDPDKPYLYAKGLFVESLMQVDYLGQPIRTERNRGLWSLAVAQGEDPYVITNSTFDSVYHHGCKWQLLVSGTLEEPRYGSSAWLMVEGNPEFTVEILSSEGWGMFTPEAFHTTLSFRPMIYNEVLPLSRFYTTDVKWTRDTGNQADDEEWALRRGNAGFTIDLDVNDLPADHSNLRSVKFTVTVTLRDGNEPLTASDEILIN